MKRGCRAFTQIYNDSLGKLTMQVVLSFNGKYMLTTGLWDTGASQSCVSEEVIQELCLSRVESRLMLSPFGDSEAGIYLIDIGLPREIKFQNMKVVGSEIGKQGLGLIIGMDIISRGDFAVTTYNGQTKISFRIPSQGHIDFEE